MVTRIRRSARPHLYIEEWLAYRGLNANTLAGRLEMDRTTVWRWVKQQHRLNPEKIAALAGALDLEPQELWRPPPHRSVDAILEGQPDDVRAMAVDIISRLIRKTA